MPSVGRTWSIERYGATTRIRVGDRRQHPDVDGLIMAAFPQATSREDDPQLHTHVVISAKVLAPDGRWMALDGRYLKRNQRALGGLYQSVLRAELTSRYGVAWGRIEKGQAEIAGMPKELLDAFSKRTAQVDAALGDKITEFREREGRDPTRWERAALTREASEDTRAKKTHATPGDLGTHWRDQAEALGWTPARLLERVREAGRTRPTPEPPTVVDVIEQLSAAGSSWHRADVLQAVCDLTPPLAGVPGQRWAAAVERACDRVIETCTTLDPPSERSPRRASDRRSIWIAPIEPHLTTEGVLAQEERILLFAIDAHDTPARPSPTLDRTGLDVLQADAAAAVAGDDALVLVVGPAGTGKTTALRRAAADLGSHRRHGCSQIRTGQGWLFAAVIIDVYSRLIMSWAVATQVRVDTPIEALRAAPHIRRPPPGLVIHSDRGFQFTSWDWLATIRRAGHLPSFDRIGTAIDNALIET